MKQETQKMLEETIIDPLETVNDWLTKGLDSPKTMASTIRLQESLANYRDAYGKDVENIKLRGREYEQNIKPGKSWETALGIIGLGADPQDVNPRGVYGKFAYKFMRNPDFYSTKMHYSHILKGAYYGHYFYYI